MASLMTMVRVRRYSFKRVIDLFYHLKKVNSKIKIKIENLL